MRAAPDGIDESPTCGKVLRDATRGFLSLPVHKNIISVVMGEDAVPVGVQSRRVRFALFLLTGASRSTRS
jgi:hypothetical protein